MRIVQPIVLVLLIVAVSARCSFSHMEYVPNAEDLRQRFGAFVVDETDLKGVYGNTDVDSVIFTYSTSFHTESHFWSKLGAKAEANNWRRVENVDRVRRYERFTAGGDKERPYGIEETRIAYDPRRRRVVVASVQADQPDSRSRFPDSGPEATFAQRVVWPRFEDLLEHAGR